MYKEVVLFSLTKNVEVVLSGKFSVYPVHLYDNNLALTCVKCKNASCTSENAEMILGYPMSQMTDPKYTGIVCKQH